MHSTVSSKLLVFYPLNKIANLGIKTIHYKARKLSVLLSASVRNIRCLEESYSLPLFQRHSPRIRYRHFQEFYCQNPENSEHLRCQSHSRSDALEQNLKQRIPTVFLLQIGILWTNYKNQCTIDVVLKWSCTHFKLFQPLISYREISICSKISQ